MFSYNEDKNSSFTYQEKNSGGVPMLLYSESIFALTTYIDYFSEQ